MSQTAQEKAQQTMRANFIDGGPGVIISGLVWIMAAIVTHFHGFQIGIICFFIGGTLIYPLSVVVDNLMKPKDTPKPDPGLMRLAMMTLPILFSGLLLAFMMSKSDPLLFYPIMAVAIGLRYLPFEKLYGLKSYWVLGAVLIAVGAAALLRSGVLPVHMAAGVGVIELGFGAYITAIRK